MISERATAGMQAARSRGKHLGRPGLALPVAHEIEVLAASTGFSIRKIQEKIGGKPSRGRIGRIVKRVRSSKTATV